MALRLKPNFHTNVRGIPKVASATKQRAKWGESLGVRLESHSLYLFLLADRESHSLHLFLSAHMHAGTQGPVKGIAG